MRRATAIIAVWVASSASSASARTPPPTAWINHACRRTRVSRAPPQEKYHGLGGGPARPRLLHRAIDNRDDRLDRQHGSDQRLRTPDAAAPPEELERVERREQPLAVAALADLTRDRRDVGALG